MDSKTQTRYEAGARIVRAVAHASRLFIVDELSRNGERCVCDLARMIGADMSTVSQHLSVLKRAGLLQNQKRGQMVYYSLHVACGLSLFECLQSVMECIAKSRQELLN